MGRDLSSFPDISHLLPRMLFAITQKESGAHHHQRINGRADLGVQNWFDPDRDASPELFACLYPLAPVSTQAALVTSWNQRLQSAAQILDDHLGGRHGIDYNALDVHPSFAFINYPNDANMSSDADSAENSLQGSLHGSWQGSWQAPGLGWYALRGEANSVFQVYARTWSQTVGSVKMRVLFA